MILCPEPADHPCNNTGGALPTLSARLNETCEAERTKLGRTQNVLFPLVGSGAAPVHRHPSARRSQVRIGTPSSTGSETPRNPKPAPGASACSSRCWPEVRRSTPVPQPRRRERQGADPGAYQNESHNGMLKRWPPNRSRSGFPRNSSVSSTHSSHRAPTRAGQPQCELESKSSLPANAATRPIEPSSPATSAFRPPQPSTALPFLRSVMPSPRNRGERAPPRRGLVG